MKINFDNKGPKYEKVFKTGEAVEGTDFPLPFPNEADIILERYFTYSIRHALSNCLDLRTALFM